MVHLNVRQKFMLVSWSVHASRLWFGMRLKQQALIFFKALGVTALQIVAFAISWNAMVSLARSYGRFPPELFFGITILNGFVFISGLFLVCSMVSAFQGIRFSLSLMLAGSSIWIFWLYPSFESRPISMPSFCAGGVILLVFGSGIVVPFICRRGKGDSAE